LVCCTKQNLATLLLSTEKNITDVNKTEMLEHQIFIASFWHDQRGDLFWFMLEKAQTFNLSFWCLYLPKPNFLNNGRHSKNFRFIKIGRQLGSVCSAGTMV
jgi:hypothetical protein